MTNDVIGNDISQEHRSAFAMIADMLIPAYKDMPAASEVDVSGALLDYVLNIRPDLKKPWIRGVETFEASENDDRLRQLYESDREAFDAVGLVAKAGYYMDDRVRKKIGYPGQERLETVDPYAPPHYLVDGSLKRVFDRGPIYVPTPGQVAESHPGPLAKNHC